MKKQKVLIKVSADGVFVYGRTKPKVRYLYIVLVVVCKFLSGLAKEGCSKTPKFP